MNIQFLGMIRKETFSSNAFSCVPDVFLLIESLINKCIIILFMKIKESSSKISRNEKKTL